MAFDAVAQPFGKRQARLAESRQHRFAHQPHFFVENPLEDMFLRAEVVVQHGVGHARCLGDRSGPRPGVSLRQKLPFRGLQDRLLLVLLRFRHAFSCINIYCYKRFRLFNN